MEHLLAGRYRAVWGFAVRKKSGQSGAKWVKHWHAFWTSCIFNIRHSHVWSRLPKNAISWKLFFAQVIKDCYMQLKAFEKSRGEGEEEDPDAGKVMTDLMLKVDLWNSWFRLRINEDPDAGKVLTGLMLKVDPWNSWFWYIWINQKTPDSDAGKLEVSCFWFYG